MHWSFPVVGLKVYFFFVGVDFILPLPLHNYPPNAFIETIYSDKHLLGGVYFQIKSTVFIRLLWVKNVIFPTGGGSFCGNPKIIVLASAT